MAMKPRVWVSRPTFSDVIARLEPWFEVHGEDEERAFDSAELASILARQDAAIVGLKERIGVAEIASASNLRIVANLAAGYDNLDLAALSRAGIAASNTGNLLNESVADHAFALLLAAARRLAHAERWLREGAWHATGFKSWLGLDVHGGTLGILGMGRIGQAIARRAQGFDMRVIYHNRSRLDAATEASCRARYVDKAELLAHADFLVVAVPLTAATRHAIGADELAAMKPSAVLINIGRGGVVDDAALANALASGRLHAAGLDVFEDEPRVNPALLAQDNVVLSPHIASATVGARRAMTATAVENVLAMFGQGAHAGRPPNLLNPEVLGAQS